MQASRERQKLQKWHFVLSSPASLWWNLHFGGCEEMAQAARQDKLQRVELAQNLCEFSCEQQVVCQQLCSFSVPPSLCVSLSPLLHLQFVLHPCQQLCFSMLV